MEWAGDDWGSLTSKHNKMRKVFDEEVHGSNLGNVEKERLLGALRASSDANGKVKIMISKKELAKLLGDSDQKQALGAGVHHHHASAEQVLARLIYARDHYDHHDAHHRHWRPALQSIPEVN